MQTDDTSQGLGYLIADLSRLHGRIFDRRAAPLGLTRAQWRALKRIHMTPGLTQAALADVMDMEPIAVGRVLDRLQKAGFIERRADPQDRRCWRLFLTGNSDTAITAIEDVASSLRHDSLKDVDPTELAITMKVLGQIRETLSQLDRVPRG
ncbi:MAG: MarR family winged helix-turn-helix transcriptional regulator [Stenotrophomonas sp.]